MRVVVTGVLGQLGSDVAVELSKRGHEVIGTDLKIDPDVDFNYVYMDITDSEVVNDVITQLEPDAIIHCAAWTAVDDAELMDNRYKVRMINDAGTQYLCKAAKCVDAKLLYLSTDYIFDGEGEEPWKVNSKPKPINFYGRSKLYGEIEVQNILTKYFIVRISWVFGLHGKNFVDTMLKIGKTHDVVRVVNDQIGSPTYTVDLARLIVDMIESEKYGIYHASNGGEYISWYDFCCAIYKQAGINCKV